MGVLMPLYLAGLAALSLPLLFHLIRRTPRGRQEFSSLMFLSPSPPRLTRRSRLDHLLLLLLRAAALALLAFAFARPFFRESAALPFDGLESRRVAILLDTSASMRRGDLWQQAVRQAENVLDELGENDDVALYTFSERAHTVVDFDDRSREPTRNKPDLIRKQLKALGPTWGTTNLGAAMVEVATELDMSNDTRGFQAEPRLVLITDLQQGSQVEALQSFEWPAEVPVVAQVVAPAKKSNATVHLLFDEEQTESAEPRVRVANATDSTEEQFYVRWTSGEGRAAQEDSLPVYVPAGQSRIVRMPRPAANLTADRLELVGDDAEFDNTYFVVPPRQQTIPVSYVGSNAADDPQGVLFYFQLALADDLLRRVDITSRRADENLHTDGGAAPKLVLFTDTAAETPPEPLRRYLEDGGTILAVPNSSGAMRWVVRLLDGVDVVENPADVKDYLLLGEIDFTHPLFLTFANPRYNDFTKIHFWKHRPLNVHDDSDTRVVARFDNGDPAILERTVGDGRMLVITSGWQPDDSQLALSSKFVPLLQSLIDYACGGALLANSVTIHEPVPLPESRDSSSVVVTKPDGECVRLAGDAPSFTATDQPGLYALRIGDDEQRCAVNLATSEGNTTPLNLEQLEQWGVKLGTELTRAERIEALRQQRDTELESRQKVWRWLIVAALVVLILETVLAGRAARQTEVARLAESSPSV